MAARSIDQSPPESLARRAAELEADAVFWRQRFTQLLCHPAVEVPTALHGLALVLTGEAASLGSAVAGLARQIAPLLRAGRPVSIDLDDALGRRALCAHRLAAHLEHGLPAALRGLGVAPLRLSLSFAMRADPDLSALLALRRVAALGLPRLQIKLPPQGPRAHESAMLWRFATALAHREPGVELVYARSSRSACDLCAMEKPSAVLPEARFAVPSGSAWLLLRLRLDQVGLRTDQGRHLHGLLRDLIRFADNLLEVMDWHNAGTRSDAIGQRRLGIQLFGLSSLIDSTGCDPAAPATARWLTRRLRYLRHSLHRESRRLARERGAFPALDTRRLRAILLERYGSAGAQRLIERRAIRHRHLLLASPFALLPTHRGRYANREYLQLVPALRSADSIATYACPVDISLADYRQGLRLAWALAEHYD